MYAKPMAGNPHVWFDDGEVVPCTAEALLRRVHCRRQPEGCASVCAAMPRRGSLLYKGLLCNNLVRIVSVLTLALSAPMLLQAWDWKPKPVAELKADLAAYARSIGETGLAHRVENSSVASDWMNVALRRGLDLLKESEGCDFNDKRRETGLRLIDFPLHFNNYSKDVSSEDLRAFNKMVYKYCADARDRVFAEVEKTRVPENHLRLWRIYNMGFVIKGPRKTVAVDVTSLPFFRNSPDRKAKPDPELTLWRAEDWRRLVKLTDLFVLTHPHSDHYGRAGIKAYLEADKPVVLPCDLARLRLAGKVDAFGMRHCVLLTKDNAVPVDVGGVKIWNFLGNQGQKVPCNSYLMDIDGVRVVHNGDNSDVSKDAMLAKCPPTDVIIGATWNRIQSLVRSCASAPGFDFKNAMLIPSHENEIMHAVTHRESYQEMYERKDRLGDRSFPWPRVYPLGWGEGIVWGKIIP